jgi:hypothetical protein
LAAAFLDVGQHEAGRARRVEGRAREDRAVADPDDGPPIGLTQ